MGPKCFRRLREHLLVIIVMMNIAGFLGLQDLAKDAFLFPATLVVTLLLVRAIEASPLKKALLR